MENIYLLGCGKTTKAIAKNFQISKIYDDREIEEDLCFNSKLFPEFLNSDDILIPTPAIPPYHQLIEKFEQNIISEYDLYYLKERFPYTIWVSGTNGKTTTTEMITHMLKDRYAESGGNIGTPLGDLSQNSSIWVLETSSFTLHYTKYAKPNLYILLPITDDHENWHGSFEAYERSKLKPLENLQEGEVAIVPDKYKDIRTDGYLITYRDTDSLSQYFGFDISKLNYSGGFLLDALLAMAVSKILFDEVDYVKMNSFQRSPHRQEEIFDSKGRLWINDSKATNPASTIAFLETIPDEQKLLLIVGGEDKGADWSEFFKVLSTKRVKIFAIGKSVEKAKLLSESFKIDFQISNSLSQAIKDIDKEYQKDIGVAVLSPASASFDQFKSYEDRGNQFKEFIKRVELDKWN